MRTTNGAGSVAGRTRGRARGIAVAGGAAALLLAGGGIVWAGPLHGHQAAHGSGVLADWNHVSNAPGIAGAGRGKGGKRPTPVQGQPGWNRVTNTPGTTGGQGGQAPGATSTPDPVVTGGQGGQAGPGGPGTITPGGQGGPGTITVMPGGQGGQAPAS